MCLGLSIFHPTLEFPLCIFHPVYFSPCVFFTLCLGLSIFHPTLEFPPVYFSPCACEFFTLCIFHPVPWTAYFSPYPGISTCVFFTLRLYFSPCVFFTLCLGLSIFHRTLEFPPCTLDCVFFTLPWNFRPGFFTACIFHPVYFSPCALD